MIDPLTNLIYPIRQRSLGDISLFFAKSVKAQHNSEISFTTLELTLLKYQINFEKIKSKIQFQNLQYSFKDQANDPTPYSGFNSY